MSLIGRLIDKLLTKGSITLLTPGKAPRTYGRGGGKHLTVRLTDRKVGFDILKSPSLGVGEAYMDGRLVIEDGTILDLLEMVQESNRWEDAAEAEGARPRCQAAAAQTPAQHPVAFAPQRRAPLRPQRRAVRTLPRRRQAVQLRLLHRPGEQPRAGAGGQEGAYRRQARH